MSGSLESRFRPMPWPLAGRASRSDRHFGDGLASRRCGCRRPCLPPPCTRWPKDGPTRIGSGSIASWIGPPSDRERTRLCPHRQGDVRDALPDEASPPVATETALTLPATELASRCLAQLRFTWPRPRPQQGARSGQASRRKEYVMTASGPHDQGGSPVPETVQKSCADVEPRSGWSIRAGPGDRTPPGRGSSSRSRA